MSGSVDTSIWPDADSIPVGDVNPGNGNPFGVIRLLGRGGGAVIQFMPSVSHADQARYLRALAEASTQVADELDPPTGGAA